MKAKNQVIWADQETLRKYKEELDYIGRPCELHEDRLIVFAIPPKKVVSKKAGKRGAQRSR